MKLPVYRPLKHLSPTSLAEWQLCEMKFYLKRMSEFDYQPDPQGKAAAVGSAFDVYVKGEFCRRLGLPFDQDAELQRTCEHDDARQIGRTLANKYIRWGFIDRRLDEGLVDFNIESRETFRINETDIPLLGYPDARFSNGTMLDWKVSGAMSASGQSPKPGYVFRSVDGVPDYSAHNRYKDPLELIDIGWARQQVIYNLFTFGKIVESGLPVAIDQVSVRGTRITISEIRTVVSKEYQQQVMNELEACWLKATEGDIADAQPSPSRCCIYNELCGVAGLCKAYTSMDETVRAIKGFK